MLDVYKDEPRRAIFVIDSKSFYASVECVDRGKNPLQTMLIVMSQQENTNGGLVLAASPMAKKNWVSVTLCGNEMCPIILIY